MAFVITTTGLPPGTAVATMEAGFSEFGVVAAKRVLPVPTPTPEVRPAISQYQFHPSIQLASGSAI